MSTYTITYWPGGPNAASATATVEAANFLFDDGFVVFTDDQRRSVYAIPTALNPVISQQPTA